MIHSNIHVLKNYKTFWTDHLTFSDVAFLHRKAFELTKYNKEVHLYNIDSCSKLVTLFCVICFNYLCKFRIFFVANTNTTSNKITRMIATTDAIMANGFQFMESAAQTDPFGSVIFAPGFDVVFSTYGEVCALVVDFV